TATSNVPSLPAHRTEPPWSKEGGERVIPSLPHWVSRKLFRASCLAACYCLLWTRGALAKRAIAIRTCAAGAGCAISEPFRISAPQTIVLSASPEAAPATFWIGRTKEKGTLSPVTFPIAEPNQQRTTFFSDASTDYFIAVDDPRMQNGFYAVFYDPTLSTAVLPASSLVRIIGSAPTVSFTITVHWTDELPFKLTSVTLEETPDD